jgi:hypothetical protein
MKTTLLQSILILFPENNLKINYLGIILYTEVFKLSILSPYRPLSCHSLNIQW